MGVSSADEYDNISSMRHRGEVLQSSNVDQKRALAQFWLAFLAVACMLASGAYASAHDHDHDHDHDHKPDTECVVCCIASLGGAKISPSDTGAELAPLRLFSLRAVLTDDFAAAVARPDFPRSRGPPLSFLAA